MRDEVRFTTLHINVPWEDPANVDFRDLVPQISSGFGVREQQGQQKLGFFFFFN